jgi:hypothetical protein
MATILDKDITRESTIKYDNREIQVTLTADQKISMKLKGMKSGIISISIEDLYNQLLAPEKPVLDIVKEVITEEPKGSIIIENVDDKPNKKNKTWNDSPTINLFELRSLSAVTVMPLETKVLFERIILELINRDKPKIKQTY